MLALETVLKVAIVGACGALLTAIVTTVGGVLASRKPSTAARKPSDELPREVLAGMLILQDRKIAELRKENRALKGKIRRLENDQQRGDP